MLGILLQESVELTIVTVKLIIKTARSVYRTFVPKQDPKLIELHELTCLKKRLDELENLIHLKDS